MEEPLCGIDWYRKHQWDHTQAEIDALTITVIKEGAKLTIPNRKELKGAVSGMVKSDRKVKR